MGESERKRGAFHSGGLGWRPVEERSLGKEHLTLNTFVLSCDEHLEGVRDVALRGKGERQQEKGE